MNRNLSDQESGAGFTDTNGISSFVEKNVDTTINYLCEYSFFM